MYSGARTDDQIIEHYYLERVASRSDSYEQLGWESRESQYTRFQVLIDGVDLEGKSLLDVGCGFGDLYALFRKTNLAVEYTGIDQLREMVDRAKRRFPSGRFLQSDIGSPIVRELAPFDVLFASGIFNLKIEDNLAFFDSAIKQMRQLCREVTVCNFLVNSASHKEEPYYYYNIDDLQRITRVHFADIKIINGYLENDCTLFCAV